MNHAVFIDTGSLTRGSGFTVSAEAVRKGYNKLVGWSVGWTQKVAYIK